MVLAGNRAKNIDDVERVETVGEARDLQPGFFGVRGWIAGEEGSRQQSYLRPVSGASEAFRAMGRTAHGEPIIGIGF